MLNGSTLNCQANYSWQTDETTLTMCRNQDQVCLLHYLDQRYYLVANYVFGVPTHRVRHSPHPQLSHLCKNLFKCVIGSLSEHVGQVHVPL